MNKELVNYIIQTLHEMNVDGETMEYIIREVGMEEQMLRQLMLKALKQDVDVLVEEKAELEK
jgi:hypothetical protein